MEENIIEEWLRSLHLGQYSDSFIDNGYDDLEICKQVGEPDLDAIGVFSHSHRSRILEAVRTLREEGGASVYFTLEETAQYGHDSCNCDRTTHSSKVRTGKSPMNGHSSKSSPSNSGDSVSSLRERRRFVDDYEESRVELIKIPKVQLRKLLKDKLILDGIRLGCPPYTNLDGTSGYLDGLASRYADEYRTHYQDVFEHLEEIRSREWEELAARLRASTSSHTPPPPSLPTTPSSPCRHLPGHCQQAMYVPGKYSPSSCLSDREEDEIYGWGYGLYGRHILKQQQARRIFSPAKCVSACSTSVYENSFGPSGDRDSCNGGKKKVASSFVNMLKTLKVHRKPKNSPCKQVNVSSAPDLPSHDPIYDNLSVPTRSSTAESLSKNLAADPLITPAGPNLMYPSSSQHWNTVVNKISIEEALLKLKEPEKANTLTQRKAEKDQILNNLRETLAKDPPETNPTSVFYTQDSGVKQVYDGRVHPTVSHWYDDPPYESDPDEYLIQTIGVPTLPEDIIKGRGVPFSPIVVSLKSTGTTPSSSLTMCSRSLEHVNLPSPHEERYHRQAWLTNNRRLGAFFKLGRNSLGASHHGPTLPILNYSRKKKRCDPDSRDNCVFKEEFLDNSDFIVDSEGVRVISPLTVLTAGTASRESSCSNTTVDRRTRSVDNVNVSSDEQEGSADRNSDLMLSRGLRSSTLVGRMRGLGKDFQKRISRLKSYRLSNDSDIPVDLDSGECLHSSAESLPSGLSSTQPLVAPGSNRSSVSAEEHGQPYTGPFIARARALVDCVPSPYDRDALKFKKDDIIDVITMNPSGIWRGVAKSRVGTFKFINVELIADEKPKSRCRSTTSGDLSDSTSIDALLRHLSLEHHTSVFVLNGYETIRSLLEIEEEDLEYLGITDPAERHRILHLSEVVGDPTSVSRLQVGCSGVPPPPEPSAPPRRSLGLFRTNSSGRSSESGYSTTSSHQEHPPPPAS